MNTTKRFIGKIILKVLQIFIPKLIFKNYSKEFGIRLMHQFHNRDTKNLTAQYLGHIKETKFKDVLMSPHHLLMTNTVNHFLSKPILNGLTQ